MSCYEYIINIDDAISYFIGTYERLILCKESASGQQQRACLQVVPGAAGYGKKTHAQCENVLSLFSVVLGITDSHVLVTEPLRLHQLAACEPKFFVI